jgi:hypothetical protein
MDEIMSFELDWAAPIVPGHSMLGLVLGTPRNEVLQSLLGQPRGNGAGTIVLRNSPQLRVDSSEQDLISLRATAITPVNYSWQNEVSRLVFRAERLSSIIVERLRGDESYAYRGVLFGKVSLGSPVAELLEFCPVEYDDAEEWFYPTGNASGFVVGGEGDCDLAADPQQRITLIRVFSERGSTAP